jgi:hypothetical protein
MRIDIIICAGCDGVVGKAVNNDKGKKIGKITAYDKTTGKATANVRKKEWEKLNVPQNIGLFLNIK